MFPCRLVLLKHHLTEARGTEGRQEGAETATTVTRAAGRGEEAEDRGRGPGTQPLLAEARGPRACHQGSSLVALCKLLPDKRS